MHAASRFALFAVALLTSALSVLPLKAEDAEPPAPSRLQPGSAQGVLARTVDGFIRPGYRRFAETTAAEQRAMAALCADPSPEALNAARSEFAAVVSAWSAIEIVRTGPAIEENRFERILFYPDRKGTGLKQVQAQLAQPDPAATDPAALSRKSVAMQGLGALEYVLFGSGAEALDKPAVSDGARFRCRYGAAIAGNLAVLADTLSAVWEAPDGVQAAWKAPGPDNPLFRDEGEAITAVLGILVHGAETVRDQRIETFYKGGNAAAQPRQGIYWRAGLTFVSIEENIAGLERLVETARIGDMVDPGQRDQLMAPIRADLAGLRRTASTINADLAVAVSDAKERAKLELMLAGTKELIFHLSDDFGGAIGLGAGFSFADGD